MFDSIFAPLLPDPVGTGCSSCMTSLMTTIFLIILTFIAGKKYKEDKKRGANLLIIAGALALFAYFIHSLNWWAIIMAIGAFFVGSEGLHFKKAAQGF